MTHIPITWKEEHEVIQVHCQPYVEKEQALVLVAGSDRYEALLARHPLAYADHAAEFYLGAGHDPARALAWARTNLLNRETRRAFELAIRAAREAHRDEEASRVVKRQAACGARAGTPGT